MKNNVRNNEQQLKKNKCYFFIKIYVFHSLRCFFFYQDILSPNVIPLSINYCTLFFPIRLSRYFVRSRVFFRLDV